MNHEHSLYLPLRKTPEDTFRNTGKRPTQGRGVEYKTKSEIRAFCRPRTPYVRSHISLNGAIAQYWAIQRWSHTKLRRVSPVPSRVPPMCPLSARSPPRSIAPSGGPKHAVWAEIRPAACRRRRRNWPLCGLSGRRGGLHSQITGGEEWEKISKKSTLTYRRNSKRVIWFN